MPVVTLRPVANVALSTWTTVGTAPWIEDDPDSPDTSDYINHGGTAGTGVQARFTMDATPADFLAATAVSVKAHHQQSGRVDDTNTYISCGIFSSAGVLWTENVALQSASFGTQNANQASPTTTTVNLTLNATGLGANKAAWDAAELRINRSQTASMGADVITQRVWAVEVDLTYTASGGGGGPLWLPPSATQRHMRQLYAA